MKNKRTAGFTLIEFIISILILSVMFIMTARLALEISDGWGFGTNRRGMAESAVIAMDRIIRETRMIKDAASVLTATASALGFTDAHDNVITFSAADSRLNRTINGATNILADNVSSLSFTYYDSAGAVIPAPTLTPSTNIRRIEVDLVFSSGGTRLSFESGACLRRLR